jgi:hypothetical protein
MTSYKLPAPWRSSNLPTFGEFAFLGGNLSAVTQQQKDRAMKTIKEISGHAFGSLVSELEEQKVYIGLAVSDQEVNHCRTESA